MLPDCRFWSPKGRQDVALRTEPPSADSVLKTLVEDRKENTEVVVAHIDGDGPIGLWLEDCSDRNYGFKVHGVSPGSAFDGLVECEDIIIAVNGNIMHDKMMLLRHLKARRSDGLSLTILGEKRIRRHVATTRASNGDLAVDDLDKRNIILNCEDIGRFGDKRQLMVWNGVEDAVKYYQNRGYFVHGVVIASTTSRHPPPLNLSDVLVKCPVMDQCTEKLASDRLFCLRLAQTYDCCFVDNWNYRELNNGTGELCSWFRQVGRRKKVEYIFDTSGNFLPLHEPR